MRLSQHLLISIIVLLSPLSQDVLGHPTANVDSLKKVVRASMKDSSLVENYLNLAETLFEVDLEESGVFASKAHHISKEINYVRGKAESLYLLGLIEERTGKLHLGLNHLKQSITFFEKLNLKDEAARSYSQMGSIYLTLGDMVKAINYQQKAIKYYTETGNDKGVGKCFAELGQTHYAQRNYNTALRYYRKAKVIYQRDSVQQPLAELYNRISLVFRALNSLDKSLEYDYLALMTQEKLRDKRGIASSNYNIGKTSILQGEIKRARGYIDYAEKLYGELGDFIGLARCQLLSAQIDLKEQNYVSAERNIQNTIQTALKVGAVRELSECYLMLAQIDNILKNHESAYEHLTRHLELRDSLFSKEKSRQFSEMEVKYQTQTKDEQLSLAQQQKQESNTKFIIYVSLSVGIFALLAFVIYTLNRKNEEVKKVTRNVEKSSEIIKLRNKEIIDSISYAKKIQEAILTPKSYLDKVFKSYFILYQPKDIVSGDFYWAYKDTASNKLFWVTADCTGHGVPGALMSVVGTVILNEIVVVKRQHEPDKILNALSKYLKRYLNKDKEDLSQDGIELALCVLNLDDQTLEYAGANRNLVIVRYKELIELKGDRQPLGFDPFSRDIKSFHTKRIAVKEQDCIYTFTDGFTDQLGGQNKKKYRVGVLKQDLIEVSDRDLFDQKVLLEQRFQQWIQSNTQLDDVLVFGVKV